MSCCKERVSQRHADALMSSTPRVIYCTGNERQRRSSLHCMYERQSAPLERLYVFSDCQSRFLLLKCAHSLTKAEPLFKSDLAPLPPEGFGLCVKLHVYSKGEAMLNAKHMAVVWHTSMEGKNMILVCISNALHAVEE